MNMSLIFGLPFSIKSWSELQQKNLSIPLLAWLLVVPLSFIPPVLMYYAGTHYGDNFFPGFADKDWRFITTTLFLAELLTFFVMGWLIHSVLEGHKVSVSYHDALALLVPVLLFNVLVVAIALALSIALVYRGCKAVSGAAGNEMASMSATYTIIAAAFLAWVLLLVIIWAY